jgi:hypothetical protein
MSEKTFAEKIETFRARVESEQIARLHEQELACEANLNNVKCHVKPGSKYTKVDVGGSGKYMVENSTGNIFGIKAYGFVHRGHFYGTLDTIDDYTWGRFYPERKTTPLPKQKRIPSIPVLTFSPEDRPPDRKATPLEMAQARRAQRMDMLENSRASRVDLYLPKGVIP